MMARRKKGDDGENLDRWLLTYADLITLLLAFFIVMYSMSQIDAKKFGKMSNALSGVLKGGGVAIKMGDDIGTAPGKGVMKIGHLISIGQKIKERFSNMEENDMVSSEITERGLVIHIMEKALFAPGSATLTERAQRTLNIVAEEIKNADNHIRIEGHTDNIPINTSRYPSNWELSSTRATEVVRYFIENFKLPPEKISALGYGEYRPIKPNNTDLNRAQNRRVDIVILTAEMTAAEPSSRLYGQSD
jgi:chemotaxis protein MotB